MGSRQYYTSLWPANGNDGFSPGLPGEIREPRKATENSRREDTFLPHVKVIQQLYSLSDYFFHYSALKAENKDNGVMTVAASITWYNH